jgi:uncharacterized zinc-type alcohol dehydrogenase-like protein
MCRQATGWAWDGFRTAACIATLVYPGTLIFGEKSLSGSALGTPYTTRNMLEFAARHNIEAITEEFDVQDINAAFEHLESDKARYRVVLKF